VAEEEKNEEVEETPEAEETPQAEETPEPEAAEEAAPAEEAPAGEEEDAPEALSPKQARKRARSQHTGEARPQRSVEERTAERVERRRKKAQQRRAWRAKSREKHKAAGPRQGTPPAEDDSANRRERQGIVVSDKADKTITVRVDFARPHRTYGKIVRTSSTLHAHDEGNEANAGDTVRVVESRPLSRTKRWRLVEILEKAR
jgi:small subunit ribosomal protein S17